VFSEYCNVGNPSVSELPRDAVTFENGEYMIDSAVLAPKLGLTPDRLKDEMRRGFVVSTSEQGEGEDAGRVRLTFRYRARVWAVVIERDGSIRELPPPRGVARPR
jgi:NFU1 iron-sulfur cluster scaffold homolog, mitochondrial